MKASLSPDPDQKESSGLLARRARLLGPAYRLFYERPLHVARGEGVWLYDADGKAYLDAYNNVPVVGHGHPAVVQAMAGQAAVLNTHTRYLHETVLDYAESLLDTFPRGLDHVMFTCSGSESNDLALRLAQTFTGGTGAIVTEFAYHGGTLATAALSPSLGHTPDPAGPIVTVAAADGYRNAAAGTRIFADQVEAAVAEMLARGVKPAALMVDTLFSSDGIHADAGPALSAAVKAVRDAGGLFIADEVQAGFGRTGTHMWGFERYGLMPDIVTLGKPMGNGHPIGGVVARAEILEAFGRRTRYFNTFGGNPVSSAAGLAVLEIIQREGLMENAANVGAYLRQLIRQLAEAHAMIGDLRGAGLFIGVELVRDRASKEAACPEASRIVNHLRENGVLISTAGPLSNVLKIRPPLPFSFDNADTLIRALDRAFHACR